MAKFDGLRAYKHLSSVKAAHFLQYLQKKFPFKIKAIQIDGGSEFKKFFEQECEKREIMLFELPPSSPVFQKPKRKDTGAPARDQGSFG